MAEFSDKQKQAFAIASVGASFISAAIVLPHILNKGQSRFDAHDDQQSALISSFGLNPETWEDELFEQLNTLSDDQFRIARIRPMEEALSRKCEGEELRVIGRTDNGHLEMIDILPEVLSSIESGDVQIRVPVGPPLDPNRFTYQLETDQITLFLLDSRGPSNDPFYNNLHSKLGTETPDGSLTFHPLSKAAIAAFCNYAAETLNTETDIEKRHAKNIQANLTQTITGLNIEDISSNSKTAPDSHPDMQSHIVQARVGQMSIDIFVDQASLGEDKNLNLDIVGLIVGEHYALHLNREEAIIAYNALQIRIAEND